MSTYKRRVVYLSDGDWAKAQERAKAFDLSISAYIRKLIDWRQPEPHFSPATSAALQRMGDRGPEVERPFPEFRPVPKPGRK